MNGSYAVSAKKRHTLNHPINAWLLNMDMTGNILWEWNEPDYSGGLRLGDDLQDIILSGDGQTIVAMGFTYDLPIDNIVPNVWAFDAVTSEQLWTNSYGGETGGTGRAGIVEAFDHGLVFFGYTNGKRLKIIKTDSTGFTVE
jgi:outer membrane protein assembly factor BamB